MSNWIKRWTRKSRRQELKAVASKRKKICKFCNKRQSSQPVSGIFHMNREKRRWRRRNIKPYQISIMILFTCTHTHNGTVRTRMSFYETIIRPTKILNTKITRKKEINLCVWFIFSVYSWRAMQLFKDTLNWCRTSSDIRLRTEECIPLKRKISS